MKLAMFLAAAYLAGSVNFSILLFRILGRGDPRRQFSGNAGVTNVYRQAGLLWAAVVLLLDVGRALVICWAALHMLPLDAVPWMGLAFIIGNRYPCFHQFRGGRGVAGYLGFTALLSPISAGISALVWVVVYGIVRIPFIASFFMIAVLALGTIIACGFRTGAIAGTMATVFLIFNNHRQNVAAFFHWDVKWEKTLSQTGSSKENKSSENDLTTR
ncbi:MAG: glycerol-3-phosphate acyltransferase [Deltaproteobacteria bacterium]|nr:glycerol-3-phosphate acyltransferase [Deltaproteobacteria bacterium]